MAKSLLTSKHEGALEYLASLALEPETSVELFEADLLTGWPWKMRHEKKWIERYDFGYDCRTIVRSERHMIFSVTIPDSSDEAVINRKREEFEAKYRASTEYYQQTLKRLKSAS